MEQEVVMIIAAFKIVEMVHAKHYQMVISVFAILEV